MDFNPQAMTPFEEWVQFVFIAKLREKIDNDIRPWQMPPNNLSREMDWGVGWQSNNPEQYKKTEELV